MKDLIRLIGLRKVYPLGTEKVVALSRIDLTIQEGEICCIHGTSGSGKSTLLNMLAGLEKPTKGDIFIGKYNIAKMSEKQLARFRRKYIGFIFQAYNLMNSMTAQENVALPLSFRGMSKKQREKRAAVALRAVGLGSRLNHKPTQMSGGQQQRVGIARAFVTKPKIVFADEPTGNLDTKTTVEVMELMVRLTKKNNQTLLIVTHDNEIASYADRIIHIVDGAVQADTINEHPSGRDFLDVVPKEEEDMTQIAGQPVSEDTAVAPALPLAPDDGPDAARSAAPQQSSASAPERR